jgi:hypothetical protein
MIGSDQVDIHPSFDIRAKRGNTFLIGVIGQTDHFQDFSICVTACPPPLILPLLPTECFREVTIRSDAYSYFSIPVDGLNEGQVILSDIFVCNSFRCLFSLNLCRQNQSRSTG